MIGIISDIHGNYPALIAVLYELDRIGCKKIISLGDVCGYYCMVRECIRELRQRNIVNIMGNHDYYMINNKKCNRSYTVNLCLDYQREILNEEDINWLKKSVQYIKRDGIWMVHGGWTDYIDEYVNDFSFLDHNNDISLYISGHTHIQAKKIGKHAVYCNPGSVGQPRDSISTAAYAIIKDNNEAELKRVEYDIDSIAYAMRKNGFQQRIYSCLYSGTKIGGDEK